MQEQLRVKSLQWLGIKPLCSRLQLPGAKITDPAFDLIDSQHEQTVESPVALAPIPTPTPAPTQQAPRQADNTVPEAQPESLRIRIDLSESVTAPARPRQTTPAPREETAADNRPQKAAGQALKYRLRLVRFHDLLFVLPQPTATWHEESTHLVFMRDIYTALYRKTPEKPLSDVFKWPPSKHLPYDNNAVNAQDALMHFTKGLLEQQEQQTSSRMIGFGMALDDYFQVTTAADGTALVINGTMPAIAANTIDSYFSDPASKRQLWQQLQAIKPDA